MDILSIVVIATNVCTNLKRQCSASLAASTAKITDLPNF